MTPEITKMLTLSTAHIDRDTAQALDEEPELDALGLSVYDKSAGEGESYGWFIYLPEEIRPDIPECLRAALERAKELGCGVLCLDHDGPEDPGLETYDWD